MKETKYYCDICEVETNKKDLYTLHLAISKDMRVDKQVDLETCENCIKQTGYTPHRDSGYINHNKTKENYKWWSKWLGWVKGWKC